MYNKLVFFIFDISGYCVLCQLIDAFRGLADAFITSDCLGIYCVSLLVIAACSHQFFLYSARNTHLFNIGGAFYINGDT
ncbi:MAG: hypothetical protein ACTS8H_00875 [Arsenophonus sp. NC-PE1-MAG3]